jgi:aminopeptidase N
MTKKYTTLSLLLLSFLFPQEPEPIKSGVAPPRGIYAPAVNALHYDVELGIGEKSDWIEGRVKIKFAVEDDSPILPIDFTGLKINTIVIEGRQVKYRHRKGVILIPLESNRIGDTVLVEIFYKGKPDDGLILGKNVHGDQTAFVDNWPNRTRFWLPSIDHPSDKATVNYTVHAPEIWKVIANGYQSSQPTETPQNAIGPKEDRLTWKWEVTVPISPYNMVIGAAEFETRIIGLAACGEAPASQREDGCVEVTYWVYPEDVKNAEPSFRRAVDMVDYFTQTIGPFPFEKLANVQSSTRYGGMENASAIFYSENGIAKGRNIEGTVSHEIAHQWFGDAVTESNWYHLWLSEGFATYFGALFFEFADGADTFNKRMDESRKSVIKSKVTNLPIIDSNEKDLFKLLNSNNYPKGGWVLHMLRGILGDDIFFRGIKAYYKRYTHQVVLTEDFQKVMEKTSGQDLNWFFQQWLYQPGYPQLKHEENWESNDGTKGVMKVRILQMQKTAWPIFKLPTEICWYNDCKSIEINQKINEFQFTFDTKPSLSGTIDPKGWVLKDIVLNK